MTRNQIKWTFGPALLVAAFFVFTSFAFPKTLSLNTSLLVEQFIIACLLIATVFTTKKFVHAGWQKKAGFAWLWIAGPLWLAVLSPIGMALPFISADAAGFGLIALTSLLVGLNEETIFRGFLLRGMQNHKGPLFAALISSFLFGLIHMVNGLVGADPLFLIAQMSVAMGAGLVLSAVTLRAGSIWPAVFLHFAADTVGLSALGGFENAVQSADQAPGMIIGGLIFGLWGIFWIWHMNRRGTLATPAAAF